MIKNSYTKASLAMTAALIAAPTFVNAQNTCIVTKYGSCVPQAAAEYLGAGINYFEDPRQVIGFDVLQVVADQQPLVFQLLIWVLPYPGIDLQ